MIEKLRPIGDRLGRRGAMLILLGFTYLIMSVGHIVRGDQPISGAFHTQIPSWMNVAMWAISGTVAIIFAWRHHDGLGWVALYLAPMIRIVSYIGSWVFYWFPGGILGSPTGWYGAAVYTPIVFGVLICSGWPEPILNNQLDEIDLDEVDHATPDVE